MLWGCLYSPNLLELDFSHLRAKGLEIRSSPQCATSSDQGAYPPPTDHNDAVYGPTHPTFLRERLFRYLQVSYR
jgi:hypothetical protein